MISLKESFTIAAAPDEVWPLIADPAAVASCIPGAELTEIGADGACKGKFTFHFGPTVAVFRGETQLTLDHAARRCTIDARGIDQRGASRARARFEAATREADGATVVTLDGGFDVNGPIEAFAKAGGVHLARALLGEFAVNLARVIAGRRAGPQAPPASAGGVEVRPASGARLIGKAALGWLRGGADSDGKERS